MNARARVSRSDRAARARVSRSDRAARARLRPAWNRARALGERAVLSALMSGLAVAVERRLVKALRQGTVQDARPARAPDDLAGGLSAQPGSEPGTYEIGHQAGRQDASRAAKHHRDPPLNSR